MFVEGGVEGSRLRNATASREVLPAPDLSRRFVRTRRNAGGEGCTAETWFVEEDVDPA